jgi:four helix bundle protein
MKSFRELRVWQAAMNLVEKIYKVTSDFPKEELYGLTSQLRRAAVSVPSNIAEGHTREHLKEYLHHISMAQASLAEVDTQLEIGWRLRYVSATRLGSVQSDLSSLGKQLYSLRNALTKKIYD